ncbi:MAG: GUN4 domain-containing protein [Cyanobacteria bacterium J06638_22]
MAKVALLIGVGEYKGLPPLAGTQEDVRVVQRVLQDPQVGGFDRVEVLPNPNRTDMERAIERLFSENCQRDDLVLLYFSGHGVRDENGALYFATTITEKNAQGRILTSTAVSSVALQGYMSQSRSKRQVLILDCCFSGAFANDMRVKGDEPIDVKSQLGSEGRVVLTSSTATQVSYEQEGSSIYTRYLVQGLESGAADRDGNGKITIDELHDYAKEKVQEAAPTMQPEIYAAREGYKILIARAPQGDPKLIFRKEVDDRARQKRGKLSLVDQRAFEFRAQELGLSVVTIDQILHEVLQTYKVFWEKVEEFERTVTEILSNEAQLSKASIDDLRYFQRVLKLRDKDIAPILQRNNVSLTQPAPIPPNPSLQQESSNFLPDVATTSRSQLPPKYPLPKPLSYSAPPPIQKPINAPPSSASSPRKAGQTWTRQKFLKVVIPAGIGIVGGGVIGRMSNQTSSEESNQTSSEEIELDYSRLESILQEGDWRRADNETLQLMLRAARREEEGWLDPGSLEDFPCEALQQLDDLWEQYSDGKFGFSVQSQIWQEVGSPTEYNEQWETFGDRVGWRKDGNWQSYGSLNFDLSLSPAGELPAFFSGGLGVVYEGSGAILGSWNGVRRGGGGLLVQRLVNCGEALQAEDCEIMAYDDMLIELINCYNQRPL